RVTSSRMRDLLFVLRPLEIHDGRIDEGLDAVETAVESTPAARRRFRIPTPPLAVTIRSRHSDIRRLRERSRRSRRATSSRAIAAHRTRPRSWIPPGWGALQHLLTQLPAQVHLLT